MSAATATQPRSLAADYRPHGAAGAGAAPGRAAAGGLPDAGPAGPGPLCRQGPSAAVPAALVLPRLLSRGQGGADPPRRRRHHLGLRPQRVRRLPGRAACRSGSCARHSITSSTGARRTCFIKVSSGPAPKLAAGIASGREDQRWYGPFAACRPGPGRAPDPERPAGAPRLRSAPCRSSSPSRRDLFVPGADRPPAPATNSATAPDPAPDW